MLKIMRNFLLSLFVVVGTPLVARDVILEFKAAYFLPTNSIFKHIYRHGGALYGPEVTFQFWQDSHWHGFASLDYFQKRGRSLGLHNATKVSMLPLGLGLKYLRSFFCDRTDFYVGLGFQPVYVCTKNCSPFVIQKLSKWGFGGIAKVGTFVHLPRNLLLDFFVDYSFVNVNRKNKCLSCTGYVAPLKAHVSGAIFGAGLGYRF